METRRVWQNKKRKDKLRWNDSMKRDLEKASENSEEWNTTWHGTHTGRE